MILNVAEVMALEQRLVRQGTPLLELMQRAGARIAAWVAGRARPGDAVVVFCGSGNNGGDGWVAAGLLADMGYPVSLVTACPASRLKAEPARTAALMVTRQAGQGLATCENPDAAAIRRLLGAPAVVIDAMLGIGLASGEVTLPYADWIKAINAARSGDAGLCVVAVDLPSGLFADSGFAAHPGIQADATITLLAYKPGLLVLSAQALVGELVLETLT
jgi:hydroxyethylthiazole kinase-like uncharacterized protein yjeF